MLTFHIYIVILSNWWQNNNLHCFYVFKVFPTEPFFTVRREILLVLLLTEGLQKIKITIPQNYMWTSLIIKLTDNIFEKVKNLHEAGEALQQAL